MFCHSCGREIEDGIRFCRYCGAPQNAAQAQPRTWSVPGSAQSNAGGPEGEGTFPSRFSGQQDAQWSGRQYPPQPVQQSHDMYGRAAGGASGPVNGPGTQNAYAGSYNGAPAYGTQYGGGNYAPAPYYGGRTANGTQRILPRSVTVLAVFSAVCFLFCVYQHWDQYHAFARNYAVNFCSAVLLVIASLKRSERSVLFPIAASVFAGLYLLGDLRSLISGEQPSPAVLFYVFRALIYSALVLSWVIFAGRGTGSRTARILRMIVCAGMVIYGAYNLWVNISILRTGIDETMKWFMYNRIAFQIGLAAFALSYIVTDRNSL